jgi:hypothetical protein
MATRNHATKALVLDAFGTVIQYGQRLAPYGRLLAGQEGAARLPFLTRDVPVATFAAELGLEHLLPDIEADLAEELAGLRLFAEVPQVLEQSRAAVCAWLCAATWRPSTAPPFSACCLAWTPTYSATRSAWPSPTRPSSSACATRWAARLVRWFSWATPSAATWTARVPSACRPGTWTGGGQSLLDVLADVLLTSDQLASIGSAYDALRANPDRGVSAASVRARLAAAGGQEPGMASIPRAAHPMTVGDLIAALQGLPTTLPVMIPAEGGIDHAGAVRVTDAARHQRNWAGTPVGQYRELPDDETTDEPFRAVVIDLDGASR